MSAKKPVAKTKVITLAITKLRTDGGTQPRSKLDLGAVADYAASVDNGVVLPPGVAFYDGKEYFLADGFHRLEALKQLKRTTVRLEVHRGTQNDAIWYAAGANKQHGLRRTQEDKRQAVIMAVASAAKMSPQPSSRDIATHVGVDHKTVEKYRVRGATNWGIPQLPDERLGRDGKKRKRPAAPKDEDGSDGEEPDDEDLDGAEAVGGDESSVETPPSGPVFDQVGQEVTDPDIAEAFTILGPMLREVAKRVKSGRRIWGSFHEEQLAAKRWRILRARSYFDVRPKVEERVKELAYSIRSDAPYAICPYCQGAPCPEDITKRCEGCGGGGWIDKMGYESAPPEMKAPPPRKPARGSGAGATHG